MKYLMGLPALFLLLIGPVAAQKKPLQITKEFKVGDRLLFRETMISEVSLQLEGKSQDQYNRYVSEYAYRLEQIHPNGDKDWSMRILRYQTLESEDGTPTYGFDSDDPKLDTTDMRNKIYGEMTKADLRMRTDAQWRLLSFSGMDATFDRIFSKLPEETAAMMQSMSASMKKNYGDEAMLQNFRSLWEFYPEKPVKKGGKWKRKRRFAGNFGMDTEYRYQLAARNDKEAEIAVAHEVTRPSSGEESELDMGVMTIKHNLAGKGSGFLKVSQPDGLLKTSEQKLRLEGTMKVMGFSMPTVVTTTLMFERLEE